MLPRMCKIKYKKLDDQYRVYSWYVRMHGMPWVGVSYTSYFSIYRNTITLHHLITFSLFIGTLLLLVYFMLSLLSNWSYLNNKWVCYTHHVTITCMSRDTCMFQILKTGGNQDRCYYNFKCTHPLGVLTAFNNQWSNLGYVLLGGLFLLIISIK